MSSLACSFKEARERSKHCLQSQCDSCSTLYWMDERDEDTVYTCPKCGCDGYGISPSDYVGIGWFKCDCKRIFAGFSKANVTSKCHGCYREILPLFVVKGDSAGDAERTKRTHKCNACVGPNECPVVNAAKRVFSGRAR